MAQIKHCDRCGKSIDGQNEIGTVINISNFVVKGGYIKPNKKLLDAAKESGWDTEYFPIEFRKEVFGEIDLCASCFKEFMELKKQPDLTEE